MKKIKTVFLLCLSMLCCLLFMFGCTKPESESEPTLAIDRDSIIMEIETSEVITVTTEGIDTSLLAWSSSNEAVATVSEGVVTSVGFGETEITVSYKDQSCKITVKVLDSGIYPNLSVGDTNISLYEEDTFQLTPTLSYAGENVTATYTYTSSDPTVATISASGLISAQSLGTATITVSTEYKAVNVEKEITVNVVCDMQTYVYVGGEQVTLQDITMYTGDVYNFTLKTFYNGQEVNATYQLPAENDIVAVADANDGYTLTAKTVGEVTVQMTAQYNGESIATNFNISVIQKVTQYTTALVGNLSESSQNVKIQVPAQIQLKGDMTLKLNGESLTATVNTTENSLYIAKDLAVAGEYDAIISNVEFSYELPLIFATKVFKQADVANFKSIIESDMAGYYVLGEDLDFADVTDFQAIGGYASTDVSLAFSGTFNGMGYSMTNLYVNEGTGTYNANESSRGSVFGYNTGIIKNVYVEFEVAALTSEHKRGIGFVGYHIGDINNVYAKVTYAGNDTGDRMRGSVVAAVYSGGSVVNCVGELNLTNGATGFGTVVGISYSGSIDSTTNCYGIVNNASISYYSDDSGRTVTYRCTNAKGAPTNSKNLALAILLTEEDFESQTGWSQYWRVTEDGVYFGERTIVEIQRATLSFANGESSLNVVYGMPIGELPAIQPFNGLEGAWSVDGEVIESGDVWQYEQDKTAIIIYRLATEANAVLDKYAYVTAENNIPTAQSIANAYQIGTLTAVYEKSSYGTNLIDAEGKIDVSGVVDSGKVSFVFVCADGTAYQMVITVIDRTLKQADVANFKTIIESNMAGYYVLGENLNFTGVTMTSIGRGATANNTNVMHFTGSFDGKGYAMTGLSISMSGTPDDYYRASVFSYVEGTIKNVYVEYNAPANWRAAAFVGDNYGVIENIYVKTTINHTSPTGYTAAIVSRNYGTLRNCVGEIELGYSASGGLKVATVVGTNYTTLANVPNYCYGVTNGIEMTYNTDGEGICNWYTNAKNKAANSKNVQSRTALLSEDFSAANGWSEYWQVEGETLYFGNRAIVGIQRTTLSFANGESSLNVVYGMPIGELPAIQPFNGLEGAWSIDGEVIETGDVWQYEQDKTAIIIYQLATEANAVLDKYAYETDENNIPTAQSIANACQIGTLTAVYEKSSYGTNLIDTEGKIDVSGVVDSGKVSFVFVCADGTAYQMVITVIDRTLKQADVANFKTIIESNMAGYYVLGENLDFTGVTLKTIGKYQGASFSGIFDGMGYAMTGITIDENGAGAYNAGVFESLTGTVRNVYVEYTVNSKTQAIGFITENGGVVENIYVKATFNSTAPVVKKYNGVVVAWHNSGAVLRNCVGEMVFADGVSGSLAVGTVLGTNYSNATTVPTTCYGVTNGITLTNGTGEGVCNHYSNTANVMKDSKNVESRSALLSEDFSAANGWSEYWQMKADGLYFGNTLIAAKA